MELNHYTIEPENNTFTDIGIDITHKCNMECKNCYIPNRDIPDMDIDKLIECISKFPKRTMLRIIGAEPTMRSDLPDIITRIKSQGHKVSLISNGLKLGNENYVLRLKKAGLRHCYISMNGVDNDDWYEIIDELRCAQRKIQALRNITKHRFVTDLGCILVKGVNDFAPYNMMQLLHKENVKNCVVRFKTIGQIGRYMDQTNFTMEEMVNTIADQVGVSNDYIFEWQKKWKYARGDSEIDSFLFPLNPNAKFVYRGGIWIKLVNWDITHSNREWPIPNSTRRGRITEDFKIAPFFEDIKLNEGNY